jgi:hypothetical protein
MASAQLGEHVWQRITVSRATRINLRSRGWSSAQLNESVSAIDQPPARIGSRVDTEALGCPSAPKPDWSNPYFVDAARPGIR